MSVAQSHAFLRRSRHLLVVGGLLTASFLCSTAIAEESGPPGLSEKVSEALTQKMKPQIDAKNWDAALAAVDAVLATVPPDGYDFAFVQDIRAKIFLQKNDLVKALDPMEKVLAIADAHKNFFDAKTVLENVYLLAQIYYQEGSSAKDPAIQQKYFNKALGYMKRWLQSSPKKSADASIFYASILYNQAVAGGEKVDLNLVKQARHEVEEGLLTAIKPKDGFYMLLLAALQQEGDFARSAEVLEMLVKQKPENKIYWQQLMATYLNLAGGNEKNETKIREYYARAINSMERAQALGLLKDPKDNYNLVTIYFNAGQFGRATDLLYAGLKKGTIESDVKNWQLLGYSYQQVNQDFQAINVYKEAAQLFPTNGQFDFLIGQIYTQMDNHAADAYAAYEVAFKKGNLEKPYQCLVLLAYSAYDLQRYEDGLKWVAEAEKLPDAKKDSQLPKMKAAIEEAIKDQKAAKETIEGKK